MKYKNRIQEIDILQKEINQHRPLVKRVLKELKEYFRISLTYTTNALEYNTLNEIETKIVIEDGITINGKPLLHHLEAIGHSEAYDYLYKFAKNKSITENDIKKLHNLFYYRIDKKNAGKYRNVKVFIKDAEHTPPPPNEIKTLMTDFVNKIPEFKNSLHPLEYSAKLHGELVTIHPFINGNGRTARLIMNLALIQSGYTICVIPPVVRYDYIQAVIKTNKGDYTEFYNFISQMVYETQKDYLRILQTLE
jgi:Fic family protein